MCNVSPTIEMERNQIVTQTRSSPQVRCQERPTALDEATDPVLRKRVGTEGRFSLGPVIFGSRKGWPRWAEANCPWPV